MENLIKPYSTKVNIHSFMHACNRASIFYNCFQHLEEGNALFKEQKFKKAISTYGKSLAYTRGLPGSKRGLDNIASMAVSESGPKTSPEQEARSIEIEGVVETNIAMCFVKLAEPRKAIEHADKALSLNKNSWKAYLRKGEAQILMMNSDGAKASLDSAWSNAPDAAAQTMITKERKKLSSLEKEETKKQKAAWAGIFNKESKA